MNKIQILDIYSNVLFEYEQEDNTLVKTVVEAVSKRANLQGAYLQRAYLEGAYLQGAYLQRADLQGADLQGAYLQGAYLQRADLQGAYLQRADLQGAYLQGAYLQRAYLDSKTQIDINCQAFVETRILPEGDIIGYKKCRNSIIVKILIPKEAKRSHAFGRKCRAEYADVLEIFGASEAVSEYDNNFVYKVGERMYPKNPFSEKWFEECDSGIHFFITRTEAENY